MALPFLDRQEELARLRRAFAVTTGTFACVYGRRRTGKSRLLLEALGAQAAGGYYCSDLREAAIQRRALAAVIAVLLPGFDRVQ